MRGESGVIKSSAAGFCLFLLSPAGNPEGSRTLLQPCAPVRKGHQTLLVARTKSSLASRGDAAPPLLLRGVDPGHHLGPRASGKCRGRTRTGVRQRRAPPLSGLCLCNHPTTSTPFLADPPPLTLRPRSLPHPHLPTVLRKHATLRSNLSPEGLQGLAVCPHSVGPHQI